MMSQFKLSLRQFLLLVVALIFLISSVKDLELNLSLLGLAFLTVIFRSLPLQLPQKDTIALDETVLLAALFIFPLSTVLILLLISAVAAYLLSPQRNIYTNLTVVSRQIIVLTLTFWLFKSIGGSFSLKTVWPNVFHLLLASLFFFFLTLIFSQWELSRREGAPFWPTFFGSLSLSGLVYLCQIAIAILTVFMYQPLKLFSFFLLSAPLLAVYYAFSNYLKIKETYRNTLRALTRTIQIEDPLQEGHSERVMDLAVDIGRELGFFGERLEKLGYAALLHDIGKLGLDINSFDYVLDSEKITEEVVPHAQIGYETLRQVKFLEPYANIIRYHHVPYVYRRNLDVVLPLESRIIAVADYFDLLVNSPWLEKRMPPKQALNKVKKDSFLFDPKVIRALVAVVRRKKGVLFRENFG